MKAKEVKKLLGVTQQTLHNYIGSGILRYNIINKYNYDYNEDDVFKLLNKPKIEKVNVTYSRVSLSKQKNDLKTQTERLYNYSINNGLNIFEQIEDVKSGMDFSNRKGFIKLIEDVKSGKIDNIIIENKDRLARFGFDLLENLFKSYGTNIIVVNNFDNKSYEEELTQDLLSIIHYFSMKSFSNKTKLNKIKQEINTFVND